MQLVLQATFITILYILVRAGDLAISAAIARASIRAVCYGIVAILALAFVVLALLHLG